MATQIRIAGIEKESIVDGPGIRYVVFVQGCKHNCPGCHNPQTHSFQSGTAMEIKEILQQIKANPLLDGITLSGGEPFEQADELAELVRKVKKLNLNVMIYTGYTYEEIMNSTDLAKSRLLGLADILVDGPYIEEEKDGMLLFKGSGNQRIIDLEQTRLTGTMKLVDF